MNTEFIVIRHGQTKANKSGILQGQIDTELDDIGLAQVQCVAKRLQGEHFDHIFASDLQRTLITAQRIGEATGCPVTPCTKLREWDLGDLQGRPSVELWQKYPQIMSAFKVEGSMYDFEVPGGESCFDFNRRVSDFLDSLVRQYSGQRLLLVSHAGVIRAMFRHIVGPAEPTVFLPLVSNTSYSRFMFREEHWQLCTWNDVSHLKSIEVRESVTF